MAINKISSTSYNSKIEQIEAYSAAVDIGANYVFKESFDFSELPLSGEISDADKETVVLKQILYSLLSNIILDGCKIVSRGVLAKNKQRAEASFKPPQNKNHPPVIYLPLPGVADPIYPICHTVASQRSRVLAELFTVVEQLGNNLNNVNLTRLLVMTGHEYGHFISFQQGNHDQKLKMGLNLLHTNAVFRNKADRYALQVFSEEVAAWRLAQDKLDENNFTYWETFNQIKYSSLKFYYQRLYLEHSSIDVYCKLSMLGIDLTKLI